MNPAVILRRALCRARVARTVPLALLLLAASRGASPLTVQIAAVAVGGSSAADLTGRDAVRALRRALEGTS